MSFLSRMACVTMVSIAIALLPSDVDAQSLDQRAWNAVWDRFEKTLPQGGKEEIVHILKVPVPAPWVTRKEEGLRELQEIAGMVPGPAFSIDPANKNLRLHVLYRNFVSDVSLPSVDEKQQALFEQANSEWNEAWTAYENVVTEYLRQWDKRVADLEARKEPVDSLARRRFRREKSGMFVSVQAKLDTAARKIQAYAPLARPWADAVRNLEQMVAASKSDLVDLWDYEGNFESASSIMQNCAADGAGWETLTFSRNQTSEHVRTSSWNGNGSWGGSFFSIGGSGGGDDFEKHIATDDESVSLKFCNLTYLNVHPSAWFDMSLLQAIDQGLLSLKDGSPLAGNRVLGPDGKIPRMIKGVIVARHIAFEARLGQTKLDEVRRSFSGSGGLRIGPFSIGGGGGRTEYNREYQSSNGAYGRSTAFDVPVVLAVVTEPTV